MNSTTLETHITHGGQLFDIFAEVDVHVARGGFDYGFGGQREVEMDFEVEVTGFSVRDKSGNEIEDKAVLRALSPLVDEAAQDDRYRLAERAIW